MFVCCSLFPRVLMRWILRNGCVHLEQKWQLKYHCTPTFQRKRYSMQQMCLTLLFYFKEKCTVLITLGVKSILIKEWVMVYYFVMYWQHIIFYSFLVCRISFSSAWVLSWTKYRTKTLFTPILTSCLIQWSIQVKWKGRSVTCPCLCHSLFKGSNLFFTYFCLSHFFSSFWRKC